MTWNIVAECVSTCILCIIWIYSRKGMPLPTLKNRLFQACFLVTFCAMTSNIFSTVLITYLIPETVVLAWAVTMVYFIVTPLMAMFYYLYALANIYEHQGKTSQFYFINATPGILYAVIALFNIVSKALFDLNMIEGYVQGPYRMTTYAVFYLYCILCMIAVAFRGKSVTRSVRVILFSFPLIAAIVILIQAFIPNVILSGSAATSSLLLIYLFLQNKQISIDYLTEMPKRQEFLTMLELKMKRGKDAHIAVIMLSLREFKRINDTYGQHNGDDLLIAVSKYLKKNLAVKEGYIFRYSGDEFAILLEEGSEERITQVVSRITQRMLLPWDTKECTCLLNGAIGIVRYPETSTAISDLINGVEYSIFLGKLSTEKNHICYCDTNILDTVKRRRKIGEILEESLRKDGFELYYQPIYSVDTGKFLNAEALLRIKNSPIENLNPEEFIPIAEESGLIVEMTYMILQKVCTVIKALQIKGIELDGINVNFSSYQFTQQNLVERVKGIIVETGVPTSKVKVEITESTLAENMEMVTDFVDHAKKLGIKIGLDDFGTGFSNLSAVTTLDFDTIKLDKSLVWSAMENKRSNIVVRNVCRAFTELGNTVLAEGVETEEQSIFVQECGCKLIQGFLYAKPMPEKEFIEFMQK